MTWIVGSVVCQGNEIGTGMGRDGVHTRAALRCNSTGTFTVFITISQAVKRLTTSVTDFGQMTKSQTHLGNSALAGKL